MNERSTPAYATAETRESRRSAVKLEQKGLEIVDAKGVGDACDFHVENDGRWCVFEGRVDSQSTKNELFALVPEVDGATWIVDKLRTGGGGRGPR